MTFMKRDAKSKKDPNFHKGSFGKVPSTAGKGTSCPKPIRSGNSYGNRPAMKRTCK